MDERNRERVVLRGWVTDPGDVSQVKQVVYLGGCWQEACRDGIVHVYCCFRHHVTDWLQLLLKILQVLVDHCAKDPLDL